MRRVVVLVFGTCVGLMGACGGDGGGDGGNGTMMQALTPADVLDAQADFFRLMCTCQMGGGNLLPANDPCVVEYTGDAQERTCKEQALQAQWPQVTQAAECQRRAYASATACLRGVPEEELDPCSVGTCLYEVDADTRACSEVFVEVTNAC